MPRTLRAVGKFLVLKPHEAKTVTSAGLHLPGVNPDGQKMYAQNHGTVISAGEEVAEKYKPGAMVVVRKCMQVQPDGPETEHVLVTHADDVVALIDETPPNPPDTIIAEAYARAVDHPTGAPDVRAHGAGE